MRPSRGSIFDCDREGLENSCSDELEDSRSHELEDSCPDESEESCAKESEESGPVITTASRFGDSYLS